jgi:hypothetical protein
MKYELEVNDDNNALVTLTGENIPEWLKKRMEEAFGKQIIIENEKQWEKQ